jgi:hypothetical protein
MHSRKVSPFTFKGKAAFREYVKDTAKSFAFKREKVFALQSRSSLPSFDTKRIELI